MRAPNADIARDPRWGRMEETYGEDPFHVGTLATAFTRGLQGDDARYWTTAALLKHFLANSNEDGRESSSSDFDERRWREYYAKAFEMAVRQGGARAMMAAYNAVNGTPAHVHRCSKSKVERPARQLRGFRRIALAPSETSTVALPLAAEDVAYWNVSRHAWVVEPGRIELLVGPSSAEVDLKLRQMVTVAP